MKMTAPMQTIWKIAPKYSPKKAMKKYQNKSSDVIKACDCTSLTISDNFCDQVVGFNYNISNWILHCVWITIKYLDLAVCAERSFVSCEKLFCLCYTSVLHNRILADDFAQLQLESMKCCNKIDGKLNLWIFSQEILTIAAQIDDKLPKIISQI